MVNVRECPLVITSLCITALANPNHKLNPNHNPNPDAEQSYNGGRLK